MRKYKRRSNLLFVNWNGVVSVANLEWRIRQPRLQKSTTIKAITTTVCHIGAQLKNGYSSKIRLKRDTEQVHKIRLKTNRNFTHEKQDTVVDLANQGCARLCLLPCPELASVPSSVKGLQKPKRFTRLMGRDENNV